LSQKNHRAGRPLPAARRRDWRKIHHSPLFWIGVFLFLAAITIYVLSDDLSWRPRAPLPR
jgi:uncharacterized iron-regulated membrane protein